MRRRAVRDISTIIGIAVILVGVVFANSQLRRGNLKDQYQAYRQSVEAQRKKGGLDLVRWDLLQQTEGNLRTGPSFPDKLADMRGQKVNLIGFMVPLDQYRAMSEFLILPVPVECYFCDAPPLRDVMLVQMAPDKTVDLYQEPVLINGTLELNEGPGTKFFYVLKDATWGPGTPDERLHRKEVSVQHKAHVAVEKMQEEPLMKGEQPPASEAQPADKPKP